MRLVTGAEPEPVEEFIILMDARSPSTVAYPLSLLITPLTFTISHQPDSASYLALASWPLRPCGKVEWPRPCAGTTRQAALKRTAAPLGSRSCSGGGGSATHRWP